MVYKMGEISVLRVTDYERWLGRCIAALEKHEGKIKRAAEDVDLGVSTMKRWIDETPQLQVAVEKAREKALREKRKVAAVPAPPPPAPPVARKFRRRRRAA